MQRNLHDCQLAFKRKTYFPIIFLCLLTLMCLLISRNLNLNYMYNYNNPRKNCTGYFELAKVPFFDDRLRGELCHKVTAYTIVNGKFPLCQLSTKLPSEIVDEIRAGTMRNYIVNDVTGRNVTIMGYRGEDFISRQIATSHTWDSHLVSGLIKIMQLLPQGDVTFLDIGSNIGVYSVTAVDSGFPTIAVDANIRSLVRIQLAARHSGWREDRLRLFWNFFHSRVSIRYIEFSTGSCNVGGAGGSVYKAPMTDTVPVMTAVADDLLSHVHTRLIVMKIDIEGSERFFFETGERLMKEKQVVAVQMEFLRPNPNDPPGLSPNYRFLVDYFTRMKYVLLSPITLRELDLETFKEWDTLWIRVDFLETVKKLAK